MKSPYLSQKAIDLLGENGYSFKSKDNQIIIKHRVGIMGAVVLLFVTVFLSIPLFAAGIVYGVGLIACVLGVLIIRRIFFSNKSSLTINLDHKTFTAIVGTYHQEDQPLKMISAITLQSTFVDEYTTAARNSVEEYLVSIRIQLITKEEITLLQLKSDQSEPTDEVNEVYGLLEGTVKSAKAA